MKLIKKNILFVIVLFSVCYSLQSQSWQWGKRGGANDALNNLGDLRQEEVYGLVTDSNKNIYILSAVGKSNLDIDDNLKTNFGDNLQVTDVALASFSCDGTYRWSKIIGGNGYDQVSSLQIDSEDNIYIAGKFGSCGNTAYPPRIDSDIILPQNPIDCAITFIAKYSNTGALLWFKRPQPAGTSSSDGLSGTASKGMNIDSLGNSYWLVLIPAGSYADGAFVNTQPGLTFHIFKYDNAGNFVSALPIALQVLGGFSSTLQFARNPYNGYFYFTSSKGTNSDSASVGGQPITHTTFISCFNNLGQFQWTREDAQTNAGSIFLYNLQFDSGNNIYLAGRMVAFNFNTFLGLTIPGTTAPGFVMKVDPTAQNLLWSTYNNRDAQQRGGIVLNGNEIAYAGYCFSTNFTWGTQTLNVTGANQGIEVLLARFNKDTGACLQLSRIQGDNGYDDAGTSIAVDASGDYIVGGYCTHILNFTTNSLMATGSQSDFFVAKYSTAVCTPLKNEDFKAPALELYPNPVESLVSISVTEITTYSVFDVSGKVLKQGTLSPQYNSIDLRDLSAGTYIIKTTAVNGVVRNAKVIKK